MNWLFLTLLTLIFRATYSIATKVLSTDVKTSHVIHSMLLTTFAGLLSLTISPFLGGISFVGITDMLVPTLFMILSQAFGNILYFKGIKYLDAGATQIAFSSILIWGTILSVLYLGSSFSFKQVVGILIMFGAILLIQVSKKKHDINQGFLYITASALLFAIFQVSSAGIFKTFSTATYLVLAYLGPTVVLGLIYFSKITQELSFLRSQLQNTTTKTLFVSSTSILYFVFSYQAYKIAPDRGVVVILLTAQVVLSVIFGIIFLKEKDNKIKKLAAGILAFIAGVLIKA